MKQMKIERAALPKRHPPRCMVSSHYWPEIEMRERQAKYLVGKSFDEVEGALSDTDAMAIVTKALGR